MAITAPSPQDLLGMLSVQQAGKQLEETERVKAYLNKWGTEYASGTLDESKRKAVEKNLIAIQEKYSMIPEFAQYANQAQIALEEGAPGITLGGAAKWGTGLVGTGAVMAASPYLLRGLWHTGAPQRAVGAGKGVHDLLRGKGGTLGEAWEAGKQPYKERSRAWRAGRREAGAAKLAKKRLVPLNEALTRMEQAAGGLPETTLRYAPEAKIKQAAAAEAAEAGMKQAAAANAQKIRMAAELDKASATTTELARKSRFAAEAKQAKDIRNLIQTRTFGAPLVQREFDAANQELIKRRLYSAVKGPTGEILGPAGKVAEAIRVSPEAQGLARKGIPLVEEGETITKRVAKITKEAPKAAPDKLATVIKNFKPERQKAILDAGENLMKLSKAMEGLAPSTKDKVRAARTARSFAKASGRGDALSKTTKGLAKWASRGGATLGMFMPDIGPEIEAAKIAERTGEDPREVLKRTRLELAILSYMGKLGKDLKGKIEQREGSALHSGRVPFTPPGM